MAGGSGNNATGDDATVGGGKGNSATGNQSTVGGGSSNTASGVGATVPGGKFNTAAGDYSFAAGCLAKALHANSFIWNGDNGCSDTLSTTGAQDFIINAPGGVGIGTNDPKSPLHLQTADLGLDFPKNGFVIEGNAWINLYTEGNPKIRFINVSGGAIVDIWQIEKTGGDLEFQYGGNTKVTFEADGDVVISGNIHKGGGSFKIDHPLHPHDKYLYHSFVESPDMKNIYDGTVTVGDAGTATVELPTYFEALNRDFRYQLTAIGTPGPNLYVSRTIEGNSFSIAGGEPGMDVSWQVTGIRKDPYAELNRIQVEVDKPADEIGTYLHPDAYGSLAEN